MQSNSKILALKVAKCNKSALIVYGGCLAHGEKKIEEDRRNRTSEYTIQYDLLLFRTMMMIKCTTVDLFVARRGRKIMLKQMIFQMYVRLYV